MTTLLMLLNIFHKNFCVLKVSYFWKNAVSKKIISNFVGILQTVGQYAECSPNTKDYWT